MKFAEANVVITGGSVGLGRALAGAFVRAGANVLLCARDAATLAATGESLRQGVVRTEQKVLWKVCDIADDKQVEAFAAEAQRTLGACDVLINNAGVQGPAGPLDEVAWAEWRRAVEIDLFGVVLPCRAFLPAMKRRGRGKIVNLSGGGAAGPRPFFSAYAAAKSAVVRVTESVAEEVRAFNIDVNAIAPGALPTRLLAEAIAAGPERIGAATHRQLTDAAREGGANLARATALCLFLAGPESDGITGRLISAVWDDWLALTARRDELAATDIYTLRRIVPADRGRTWGGKA